MRFYKSYESLFYNIESFYDKIFGLGGSYFKVIGLISTLQWINILFLASLFYDIKDGILFYIILYALIGISNLVYFKDSRVQDILIRFSNQDQRTRLFSRICSLIYIILSFSLLIITVK